MNEDDSCPICATIPVGKIFQCKEGHIVCESCLRNIQETADKSSRLSKCPSCAGPLDDNAVCRNRALESMLDRLTLNCLYAKNGCQVELKRNEVENHEASCLYGEEFHVCSLFGRKDCSFKLSAGTAHNVLQHIKSDHKPVIANGITWQLSLGSTWEYVMNAGNNHQFVNSIVRVPNSQKHVLLIIEVTKHHLSIYFVDISLNLSVEENIQATVSIADDAAPFLTWTFSLTCGLDSWKFLKEKDGPKSVDIGIQSLIQYCGANGKLGVCVKII